MSYGLHKKNRSVLNFGMSDIGLSPGHMPPGPRQKPPPWTIGPLSLSLQTASLLTSAMSANSVKGKSSMISEATKAVSTLASYGSRTNRSD